jgi:sporulation protein YunB
MIRNSILYHRLWYVRRKSFWKIRVYTGMILIILCVAIFTIYAEKSAIPYLEDLSEYKVKAIVTDAVNRVVAQELIDSEKYKDIVIYSRDNYNNISSIETDINKTNKLSAEISSKIQDALLTSENEGISIPAGAIFRSKLFESAGSDIHIAILPYGNVETNFKSELSSAGQNQSQFRLFVQVNVEAEVRLFFMYKKTEITTNVPVVETLIVGKAS